MSLCCCTRKEEDDFSDMFDIDKTLIDYAKKAHDYEYRFSWFRPKRAFEVNWKQLEVTSEVCEFKIMPENLNTAMIQEYINKKSTSDDEDSAKKGPQEEKEQVKKIEETENENKPSTSNSDCQGAKKEDQTPLLDAERSEQTSTSTATKNQTTPEVLELQNLPDKNVIRPVVFKPVSEMNKEELRKNIPEAEPKRNLMRLYETEYTNTSGKDQSFTFKTNRMTSSSATITVQNSCKIGGEVNVGLKATPKLDLSAKLTQEFQRTKSKSKTVTTQEEWGVDNEVNVGANTTVVAELSVNEDQATAFFKIKHKVSPKINPFFDPNDSLNINIYKKSEMQKKPEKRKVLKYLPLFKRAKENNSFVKAFWDAERKCDRYPEVKVNWEENCVEYFTEETLKCLYQCKQVMKVNKTHTFPEEKSTETAALKADAVAQTCSDAP